MAAVPLDRIWQPLLSVTGPDETGELDRLITSKEAESAIRNLPKNTNPAPDGFTGDSYQTFKEKLIPILLKLS